MHPPMANLLQIRVLGRTAGVLFTIVLLAGRWLPAADLVRDGRPVATIVVIGATPSPEEAGESKPGESQKGGAKAGGDSKQKKQSPKAKPKVPVRDDDEAAAVRLLSEWVRKITDVDLPVSDRAPAEGTAIYVGRAAIQAGLKLDQIESPSREGLRIVADDRRVLIAGQSEPATMKAVCRFLETLGCRCFMDGPLGEVFPRSKTLSVGRLDVQEKPGLIGRNPKGPSWRGGVWKIWNGAGGEMLQHQHAWGNYISPKLFDEHPEYFAMGADGQRKAGGWLCTSNAKLREEFAAGVSAAIEKGLKHPSLSPTDGRGYCQCPQCKAQDDPNSREPSSGTVAVTNRYVDFFDDVARRVAAKHPDSVLSFYCYADYTQPPTVRRKLSPNLCAVIAPIRYCRQHEIGHEGCASRMQQLQMTDGWAQVASRLGYYNYMYNLADATLPMFKFTACKQEFPYLHSKGLSFMTLEMLSNWHIYGPQMYLSLRMAYDPSLDADALMEDYWQRFYGPKAAGPMKEYWMGIDAAQGKLRSHAGSYHGLHQIYTPEFMEQCRERLSRAARAAESDETYKRRVALHASGFESVLEYKQMCAAMNAGDFAAADAAYERSVARLQTLSREGLVNPEYATAYLQRFMSKAIKAGVVATAKPNRVAQVLPDRWRVAVEEGESSSPPSWEAPKFDDAKWLAVRTRDVTLDSQGLDRNAVLWFRTKFVLDAKSAQEAGRRWTLFFGEVDGATEVFVNGRKLETRPAAPEAQVRPRLPFVVDATDALVEGENCVALRVDHTKITELSLGGLLRPVVLIERRGE